MEIHELQQLLSEMSLQEKIGQMVQLTGVYFDKEAVLTGVVGEQLPPEWIIQYAGSVLGVIGKDKIYDIQSRYMEQHPHHIPLLFMADVIHGCRTIFPIPLGQACSFHPELVSEVDSNLGFSLTYSPLSFSAVKSKAYSPIEVIPSGSSTFSKARQPVNA